MDKKEFLKEAKELIECCETVYLGTYNETYDSGESRAMANMRFSEKYPDNLELFEEGDLSNFIITAVSTEKMDHFKTNKNVSLYYFCPKLYKSLTLFGKIEVLEDKTIKNKLWCDELKKYFRFGLEDPEYTVVKFIPTVAKFYNDKYEKHIIEL